MSETPKPSEIETDETEQSLVTGDASVPGTRPPAAVPEQEPEPIEEPPTPDRSDEDD